MTTILAFSPYLNMPKASVDLPVVVIASTSKETGASFVDHCHIGPISWIIRWVGSASSVFVISRSSIFRAFHEIRTSGSSRRSQQVTTLPSERLPDRAIRCTRTAMSSIYSVTKWRSREPKLLPFAGQRLHATMTLPECANLHASNGCLWPRCREDSRPLPVKRNHLRTTCAANFPNSCISIVQTQQSTVI
jgi:hypothetical protein